MSTPTFDPLSCFVKICSESTCPKLTAVARILSKYTRKTADMSVDAIPDTFGLRPNVFGGPSVDKMSASLMEEATRTATAFSELRTQDKELYKRSLPLRLLVMKAHLKKAASIVDRVDGHRDGALRFDWPTVERILLEEQKKFFDAPPGGDSANPGLAFKPEVVLTMASAIAINVVSQVLNLTTSGSIDSWVEAVAYPLLVRAAAFEVGENLGSLLRRQAPFSDNHVWEAVAELEQKLGVQIGLSDADPRWKSNANVFELPAWSQLRELLSAWEKISKFSKPIIDALSLFTPQLGATRRR